MPLNPAFRKKAGSLYFDTVAGSPGLLCTISNSQGNRSDWAETARLNPPNRQAKIFPLMFIRRL